MTSDDDDLFTFGNALCNNEKGESERLFYRGIENIRWRRCVQLLCVLVFAQTILTLTTLAHVVRFKII